MKKKYEIDALKKRVFIRKYASIEKFGDEVTFEEWMNTVETSLEMGHGEYQARIVINRKEHTRLLKQLETIATKYIEIIDEYHVENFNDLINQVRWQNQCMQPISKRDGRFPIPGYIAEQLLRGMGISKKETRNYELFRIYYHHAIKNDFNMPERAEKLANGYWPEGTKYDPKSYKLEKGYTNYFPSVPASAQPNNDWARRFKQTLKEIIKKEKL